MKTSAVSRIDFSLLAFGYKIRDLRRTKMKILREVGIKQGFHVLDYGCGPGSYLVPLAELVGDSGRIYALDVNPLAVHAVERIVARNKLTNVHTILSDRETGLPSGSIDVVLLYDILHHLKEYNKVSAELHRVLKPGGILSVNDHHLKMDEIISRITDNGLFVLPTKVDAATNFTRKDQ